MSMERVKEIENFIKEFNVYSTQVKSLNEDIQFLIDTVKQQNEQIEKAEKKLQTSRDSIVPISEENDELRYQNNQKNQRIEEMRKVMAEVKKDIKYTSENSPSAEKFIMRFGKWHEKLGKALKK